MISKKQIAQLEKQGKIKSYQIPLVVPESFVEKFKEQREQHSEAGLFIDIKRTDKGMDIMVIGVNPDLALILIGIAYGAGGYK